MTTHNTFGAMRHSRTASRCIRGKRLTTIPAATAIVVISCKSAPPRSSDGDDDGGAAAATATVSSSDVLPLLSRSFRLKTTLKLSLLMMLLERRTHAIRLELESIRNEQLLSLCKRLTVTEPPDQKTGRKIMQGGAYHISASGLRSQHNCRL
jgi:hypothetical protein